MKVLLLTLLFPVISLASSKTWYESHYSDKRLKKKYKLINENFSEEKFKAVFSLRNKFCEPELIQELLPLGANNVKYGLILANKKGYIDQVETDILLGYINYLKKRAPGQVPKVQKGKKIIAAYYFRFLAKKDCLSEKWKDFESKMNVLTTDDDRTLGPLNSYAYRAGLLTKQQYMLIEMTRLHQENLKSSLSISQYHEKRRSLERAGFKLNKNITEFHNSNRKKKNIASSRYELYTDYTLLQMKDMLELIDKLEKRFKYEKSEIVYLDNGEVKERISLNPTEQLRLGIKLYNREKDAVLAQSYFKGKDFSYRTLLTLSYEVGHIDDNEIEAFAKLEKKTKKKNFWQKVTGFMGRLDFLVSSLLGPVYGISYALTVSFVDQLVQPKVQENPEYKHDLFYGNCEMKL